MLKNELKLGFGCMRLPMEGDKVNLTAFSEMIDSFMAAGGRYFDTAHNYLSEQSEPAIRKCLVERYPRESYLLTTKLTSLYYETAEDVPAIFEEQLKTCGVEYFDFYLCHAMSKERYEKGLKCRIFDYLQEFKRQGRIRHIGISFHDTPEVLERILKEQPCIEIVQLQFNYADYDNPDVQSMKCYEVCEKYGKPVIVMEPVKGGKLVDLPKEGREVLDKLGRGSYASYALRYCASFENIVMILSGMSDQAQMEDNLATIKDPQPFTEAEFEAVARVRKILWESQQIPCTDCRYCTDVCPQNIAIPQLFAAQNARMCLEAWQPVETTSPLSCVDCGACENTCPQHLPIRKLLKRTMPVVRT